MKLPRVFFDSDGVDRATLVHVFVDWSTCISILFVVLFDIFGGGGGFVWKKDVLFCLGPGERFPI